jgi:hypothetical protein
VQAIAFSECKGTSLENLRLCQPVSNTLIDLRIGNGRLVIKAWSIHQNQAAPEKVSLHIWRDNSVVLGHLLGARSERSSHSDALILAILLDKLTRTATRVRTVGGDEATLTVLFPDPVFPINLGAESAGPLKIE